MARLPACRPEFAAAHSLRLGNGLLGKVHPSRQIFRQARKNKRGNGLAPPPMVWSDKMDTTGAINATIAYMLEGMDSPGIVIPEKFRSPILHLSSGRIKRNEPTVTIRGTEEPDEFPLVSEKLGWWHEHRARVRIGEYKSSGRFEPIGLYHIDALTRNGDEFAWEAIFRIVGRFDYGNRLNLNVAMRKAWAESFHRWVVQSRSAGTSMSSDYNSVTITMVGTNAVPSDAIHFKTIFKGPNTSGLDESIGRIERALRDLEGEICLNVGHISLSRMTDCPEKFTLGRHCKLLRKAHPKDSCPADSELHSALHRAICLVEDKILDWRNDFAHGLPSFDARVVRDGFLGDFDEKTNTFTSTENIPQPLMFIRHKEKDLELTPEILIQIEKDIIEAWSIFSVFNVTKYAKLEEGVFNIEHQTQANVPNAPDTT